MSVQLSQHQLTTALDLPLRLDLRRPADREALAGVVVVHGFKGFKDWGFFPHVSERLAEDGLAVATLDLSLNGVGEEPGEFTRLDLFERNTYGQELADLAQVVGWLREEAPVRWAEAGPVLGLLGHSRGALPVVLLAAEDPSIRAIVTWNGVGRALRYTDRQLREWEQAGRMEFTNARTGQRMAVGWALVEEVRAQPERFDLGAAARRMTARHLVLHGSGDLAVDPAEAELLRAGRSEADGCRVEILEGATHTFGAVHPFEGSTDHLDEAIRLSREWFRAQLIG